MTMADALKITYLPLDKLLPYARNSRTHSDEQVAQIAGSIKEFGFTNPVLVDSDGGIIAGHGRVMAARKLGMDKVPTICLGHLTETQRRAYVIADNKLALNAGWDDALLRVEFAALQDADFDLSKMGFSGKEIADLLGVEDDSGDDNDEPSDESKNLLLIECQGERELEKLFEEMQERGFTCKVMS